METVDPSDGDDGVTVQVAFVGAPLQDIVTAPLSDGTELSSSA
jgi:hypothetical protein